MSIDPLVTDEGSKIISEYDLGLEPILPEDVGYKNPRARPVYDALFSVMREKRYLDEEGKTLVLCNIQRKLYVNDDGHYILKVTANINL